VRLPGGAVVVAPGDARAAERRQRGDEPDPIRLWVDAHPRRHEAARRGSARVERHPGRAGIRGAHHELRALKLVPRGRGRLVRARGVQDLSGSCYSDVGGLAGDADEVRAWQWRVPPRPPDGDAAPEVLARAPRGVAPESRQPSYEPRDAEVARG